MIRSIDNIVHLLCSAIFDNTNNSTHDKCKDVIIRLNSYFRENNKIKNFFIKSCCFITKKLLNNYIFTMH